MPEYSNSEDEVIDAEPVQLQPFIHQVRHQQILVHVVI